MDGYAVIAADTSPWREVIGVQTAGSMLDVEVTDGTAIRITTGAPIPIGADAVVKVENTEIPTTTSSFIKKRSTMVEYPGGRGRYR